LWRGRGASVVLIYFLTIGYYSDTINFRSTSILLALGAITSFLRLFIYKLCVFWCIFDFVYLCWSF